jgi:acyl-CoA thioester hydrolase
VEGFDFATPVRVRFAETDAQGVAHHASYLVWFEVARVAFLEQVAGGYQRLRDEGVESLVLEAHVHFRAPAFFDDRLVVHARCHGPRGARFRFDYAIERAGVVLADGWTAHATVDAATLRPTRTPAWLVAAIAGSAAQPRPPTSPGPSASSPQGRPGPA